jgi:hypothetical protein
MFGLEIVKTTDSQLDTMFRNKIDLDATEIEIKRLISNLQKLMFLLKIAMPLA